MSRKRILSAIQMDANPAPTPERLARAEKLVAAAAQAGADLIVLPELFNVGYTYDDSNHERAEPLDGPTSTWMRETARKFNLHLAGSIMLLDVDEVYNALLLFAPDGRVWRYDKIYPWGWERGYFRSGRDVTVAKTGLGRIGMLICWDTGHRGLWQRYAGQVDLILISSCPPDITNPTYRFPDGRTATFADMGPLRSIQNTGRHLFGDMINEQTAWLGVPAVASVGAGRITTRLPQAKASVASMIVLAPWLARYLPVADQIKMSCDLIHGCKVVDARGNVLTEIPQGEGDAFTLAEVTLPEEQPTPAGPQPPTRLQPFSYFTSDYLFPWLTIPVYRKGLRQVWGPQMAPIEASTRLSTILTVTFGLQMMRLLLPLFQQYLRDSVGVGSLTLAPIALGLFAFGFLAAGVRRLAGTRRALWITSGGLAVVRVLEQFSTSSPVDFGLSALGVVLFLWYVPVAVGAMRGKGGDALKLFGLSFLLGVAFDTALFGALGTLDLSWRAGAYPIIVVVFLAVVLFAALRDFVSAMPVDAVGDAPWGNALALLALGPWLFLQMLIVQNLARTAAVAGWVLPAAVSATIAGNVIGIAVAQLVMRSNLRVGVAGLGFGAVLLVANQLSGGTMGLTGGVLIFVSAIVSPALFLLLIKATEGEGSVSPGLKRLTVMHATGQMLFVMLTFLYYVSYDIPLGFRANVIPPIAGMLVILSLALAAARWQKLSDSTPVQRAYPMIAVVFLAAPLILWLGWRTPAAAPPDLGSHTARIISYNLHMRFDTGGRLGIEELARQIEASGADIIGLQEVSRGYLTTGSFDMLSRLSQRLGMPYVWGPTPDLQWGNVILSRYPIVEASTHPLPPSSLLLRRGYIVAKIDIGAETITVIATHLHHRSDGSDIRQIQVETLIDVWGNAPRTVILGDLNATSDTPEMEMLAGAGLVSVSEAIGTPPTFTFYSADPGRQLDYIWISPDLAPSDFDIPQTTASDHLPVVVTVGVMR